MEQDSILAQKMQEKGIRPSFQRIVIYKYLAENKNHPTVDAVYSALSPLHPTLSRTTVYNTLHLFAQNKLVQQVNIEDDQARYDVETEPHMHFKCTKCGKIIDICNEKVTDFYRDCNAVLPEHFSMERSEINVWGVCASCS